MVNHGDTIFHLKEEAGDGFWTFMVHVVCWLNLILNHLIPGSLLWIAI